MTSLHTSQKYHDTNPTEFLDTSVAWDSQKYDSDGIGFLSTAGTQTWEGKYLTTFQSTFKDDFDHKMKPMVFIYQIFFLYVNNVLLYLVQAVMYQPVTQMGLHGNPSTQTVVDMVQEYFCTS